MTLTRNNHCERGLILSSVHRQGTAAKEAYNRGNIVTISIDVRCHLYQQFLITSIISQAHATQGNSCQKQAHQFISISPTRVARCHCYPDYILHTRVQLYRLQFDLHNIFEFHYKNQSVKHNFLSYNIIFFILQRPTTGSNGENNKSSCTAK